MSFAAIISGIDAAMGNKDVVTTSSESQFSPLAREQDFKTLSRLALRNGMAARQELMVGFGTSAETGKASAESETGAVEKLVEKLVGQKLRAEVAPFPEGDAAASLEDRWRDRCLPDRTEHWMKFSAFSFHLQHTQVRIFSTGSLGNSFGVRSLSLRMTLSSFHLQSMCCGRQELRLPVPLQLFFTRDKWQDSLAMSVYRLFAGDERGEQEQCGEVELLPGRRQIDGVRGMDPSYVVEHTWKNDNGPEKTTVSESLWKWQDRGG